MTEPLVDVTGIRRERERRRLMWWLKIAGIVGGVVVALGVVAWVFLVSSLLSVQEVRVEGVSLVGPEAVVAAADIQVGTPLARVDTSAAARRVVQLREVAAADVVLGWPHEVTIIVHERQARVVLPLGSEYALVDGTGTVFAMVQKRPKGVPIAQVSSADPETLASVALVADLLPDDVRASVLKLKAESLDAITLELTKGRRVVWGSAEESELKAKVLVPLLTKPGRIYDVSAPADPTMRR